MGFHIRGDEESSVQEDSRGKTLLLAGAHPCAKWRSKSTVSWSRMTPRERERRRAEQSPSTHAVCHMFKLQHDEGRYFLHEHRQSELPWREDCVEEIQDMIGAKLMSASQGSFQSAVCPVIAFTSRVSVERKEHKSIEDLQTAQVSFGQCGRQEPSCELQRSRDESNEDWLDQAWDDHTGASLDAKVMEARQLEMDKVPVAQCWERTGKAP